MDLSVIIVSYNVCGYLRCCLASLQDAAAGISCEITVTDNNSGDDTCRMVKNEFPNVRLIRNNANKGFAAACNQGISVSSGKYVLLLNPDTLLPPGSLAECLAFMNLHPEAGALGVKMTDADGTYLPESKRAFPSVASAFFKAFGFAGLFPRNTLMNKYYLPSVGIDETAVTEVIAGAFMMIRKDILEKTGLLDEDYFMYGEDIELSYRIAQSGCRNYYLGSVTITHFKGRSTPRHRYEDIRHFYRAMRIYVRKRHAEGYFRYSLPALIAGIIIREYVALSGRFLSIKIRSFSGPETEKV